ncbi:MAG TPA: hypothetical protein VMU59_10225 [Caulobacteraceae bacterium]|nr:hypothetical protein [Caulobacteraceae bacterium]
MDYGERKARRLTRGEIAIRWASLTAMALIAAGTLAGILAQRMARQAAEAPYWTLAGPACPTLTAAAARATPVGPSFDYGDVDFARAYGDVSCTQRPYAGTLGLATYPVCEFTSPDVLKITVAGRAVYFRPGPGQPATVAVKRGVASCVEASNFR